MTQNDEAERLARDCETAAWCLISEGGFESGQATLTEAAALIRAQAARSAMLEARLQTTMNAVSSIERDEEAARASAEAAEADVARPSAPLLKKRPRNAMIYRLHLPRYRESIEQLPADLREAWAGESRSSNLIRLTETYYAFRYASGEGDWIIGELSELLPYFAEMQTRRPHRAQPRNVPSTVSSEELSNLLADLGL